MPLPKQQATQQNRKKRRYNTRLIKQRRNYTIQEIAALFDVHKNAVRRWLKKGLPTIDSIKPLLIHGSDLKAFLDDMQQAKKRPCKANEMYCFSCKAPRQPYGLMVDIHKVGNTDSRINVSGLCSVCGGVINRLDTTASIPRYERLFDVQNINKPLPTTSKQTDT